MFADTRYLESPQSFIKCCGLMCMCVSKLAKEEEESNMLRREKNVVTNEHTNEKCKETLS